MSGLTRDELLDVIIALDNEACRCDNVAESERFRSLKWKVFTLLIEVEKVVDNGTR